MFSDLLESIGYSVCHQVAYKSALFDFAQTIACSRCAGIYLGFLISFLFLAFLEKKKNDYPSLRISLFAVFYISIMALDGLLSYLGIRETSNNIRLLTGLMAGTAISIFLVPPFNHYLHRLKDEKSILDDMRLKIIFFALPVIDLVLIYLISRTFPPLLDLLVAFSIFFIFFIINIDILMIALDRTALMKPEGNLWGFIALFILSFLLSSMELYSLFKLHLAVSSF